MWRCVGVALVVAGLGLVYGRFEPPEDLAEWRLLVGVWLTLFVVSGITLTIAARIFHSNDATVSATLQEWFQEWPVLAAALFFFLGHVVWPIWKR